MGNPPHFFILNTNTAPGLTTPKKDVGLYPLRPTHFLYCQFVICFWT